jgi:drug/metabolite transporter (DMT)-like permease
MTWFPLAVISVITDSTATITQRILMKSVKSDPVAYMIIFQFLTSALIGLYLLMTGSFQLPPTIPYANMFLSGILISVASLYLFKALKHLEASELAIYATTGVFWNTTTSALFLGESITPKRLLATLLIVAAVLTVSWQRGQKLTFSQGAQYALISATAFGLAFTNDAYILRSFEAINYLFFGFMLPGIIILLLRPQATRKMKPLLTFNIGTKMVLFCVLYGLQAITIFKAYQAGGDASQIYPISRTYVILTVILGVIFLKERDNLAKKFLSALLAFLGVLIIR